MTVGDQQVDGGVARMEVTGVGMVDGDVPRRHRFPPPTMPAASAGACRRTPP